MRKAVIMANTEETVKRLPKPSGWAFPPGGSFYNKSSKHGLRYMCVHCGRKNLGLGPARYMHYPKCHRHPDSQEAAVK
jgi:hypothetical protein